VYFSNDTKTLQTEFEFLFKNCTEKPYTCFLEKIGFFTRNPTKLDLHFSEFFTIFNDFSKLQLKTLKQLYSRGLEHIFRNYVEVPGLRKSPWKEQRRCNVVPGRTGRRENPKSGELVAGMDRRSGGD
jgi:hypothetical protein